MKKFGGNSTTVKRTVNKKLSNVESKQLKEKLDNLIYDEARLVYDFNWLNEKLVELNNTLLWTNLNDRNKKDIEILVKDYDKFLGVLWSLDSIVEEIEESIIDIKENIS